MVVSNTNEEALKVLADLKVAPELFEKIAEERSVDYSKSKAGDLGLVGKDDTAPEIFKAASKLKPGQFTTKPVKYYTKYSICRIDDKIKAEIKTLDQVKSQISGQIQKERQQALYEGLLKRLKDEAKIEYFIETPETEQPQEKPEIKPEPKTNKPPKSGK